MNLSKYTLWTIAGLMIVMNHFSELIAVDAAQGTFQQDFTSVAQKAVPAVVSIQVKTKSLQTSDKENLDFFNDDFFQRFFGAPLIPQTPEMELGQASGFIVSPEGYIITNSHVVKNATEIEVTLTDDRHFSAKVIGQDPSTDVAVLKIDAKDLPFLAFGNSDDIKIGQWAIAIGTPLGLNASLTVGVISAKGRNNLDIARIEDFIQTDASINMGNSGGALVDAQGRLVCINTAILSRTGGNQGVGFAIPSNMGRGVMERLISNGKVTRGFLGIGLQPLTPELAERLDLPLAPPTVGSLAWARSIDGRSYVAEVLATTPERTQVRFLRGGEHAIPTEGVRPCAFLPGERVSCDWPMWGPWTGTVVAYSPERQRIKLSDGWGSTRTFRVSEVWLAPAAAAPEPAPIPARRSAPGGLSEEDRKLIEEHLRRRIESERQNA